MLTLDVATLRYPLRYPHVSAYPNLNSAKVYEDCCTIGFRKPAFVVADGVTRSAEIGAGDLCMALGAWLCVNAFCNAARNSLSMPIPFDASTLKEAFLTGNRVVKEMNTIFGVTPETTDWFKRDLFGTCAVLGTIDDNGTLFYGWIGDCSIAVFDKDDMPRLITPEDVSILEQYREGLGLSEKERMIFWREKLRNHHNEPHL